MFYIETYNFYIYNMYSKNVIFGLDFFALSNFGT